MNLYNANFIVTASGGMFQNFRGMKSSLESHAFSTEEEATKFVDEIALIFVGTISVSKVFKIANIRPIWQNK